MSDFDRQLPRLDHPFSNLTYSRADVRQMLQTYRAAQDNRNAKPLWWADFHEALGMMKPADKEILQYLMAGRCRRGTITVAARKLGISPATARKRAQRAKARLCWALNRHVHFLGTVEDGVSRRPRGL